MDIDKIWKYDIIIGMGLAFEAIYPVVYSVALELFKNGMERHWVAEEIFDRFGLKYDVPKNKLNTAMIDLTITCAENDFKNKLKEGSSGRIVEDKNIARLLGIANEKL